VGYIGSVPLMVAVNNDVPAKTLKEFVDLAKAKPGQVTCRLAPAPRSRCRPRCWPA
jgi:tripartite-type tricarboxylate transporter receptor subunit TctC